MIDWNLLAKVAGGGYGITILVLLILALAAWLKINPMIGAAGYQPSLCQPE